MNVPHSLQIAYNHLLPELQALEYVVNRGLHKVAAQLDAQMYSRVKSAESVCLKLERSPHLSLAQIDDLYAATIVVTRASLVQRAVDALLAEFDQVTVKSNRVTKPEEFQYDDLHAILRLREADRPPVGAGGDRQFEVQVKTRLQDALATITQAHIYKGPRQTWAQTRQAAQIRAALEMLDQLIDRQLLADDPSTSGQSQPEDTEKYELYRQRNLIIEVIENWWQGTPLTDHRHAAIVVQRYLALANEPVENLQPLLHQANATYSQMTSLPPTHCVLMALYSLRQDAILSSLSSGSKRLLVTPEMITFCPGLADVPEANRAQY